MTSATRSSTLRELTLRSVILGGLITLVFTAANVYLGLKVGLTFATAIPAAVISMSVLRYFANHSIVENNIVQTIASAAGTLSAIIFVLPGLIMIGWWTGFPYWETVAVCAIGGILGVMYSIPLRRVLVTGSDLPFPEGVAAAEVLKVGDSEVGAEQNRGGMRMIVTGSLVAAGFSLLASLKVVASSVSGAFKVAGGASMWGASLSMALIGVGHLVGVSVGVAMLVGLVISYFVLLPIRSSGEIGAGDLLDQVSTIFAGDVRFIGAGAIAVAAVWTLLTLIVPIVRGIVDSVASARKRRGGELVDITERDIPIQYVGGVVLISMIPVGWLLWDFLQDSVIAQNAGGMVAISVIFVLSIGLIVGAVCGYMAGLIGSSNSPISGVGILVVLLAAVLLKATHGSDGGDEALAMTAYTLFTAAVVFGIATISNDNLQDLKTGQLVGATPWKQQVALVIGVMFGAIVIPPVLGLMNTAFGFQGAPGAGDDALAAPQAALMSSLAQGVFGSDLDWGLIWLGVAIGAVVIVVDEVLKRTTSFRLPPLAVGMGMYLPMALTLIIPIGAFIGRAYDNWADRDRADAARKKRLGVLMATGLIVGESLYGVLFAGLIAGTGKEEPLALPFLGEGYSTAAQVVGVFVFVGLIVWLYSFVRKTASKPYDGPPVKSVL
ncbi:oligopeptide transporter, OPT family [Gordonia iterans]|uniref:Oligopeptide transporter, OPT family n=1 Tax=Gordonia iterans TaxID=1004901 RepID=A0A2S0KHJ3_9ACTN|nr:oligopeptide transporter, OPT family [Gordonia iterans]AVM01116.1 oligopeptide transporter, OPT family [Gordonia iterans]